ncbi:MAG: ABC transporter permease YtrF precursor [Candidatus Heimdallarchaeota archaeon LC_3]|nr:MAG: ABC transporter permease YtrF precursor [Candidatus Heimdallarchaeota archaeon LC_3]
MGLRSSFKTARLALTRRKIKNMSAILAIALGVTLMVGIQITTDTLENSFTTGLLLNEGEVDIRVSNVTGIYLSSADYQNISSLVEGEEGIMPELSTVIPALIGSQFEPTVQIAGIDSVYPEVFGSFENWQNDEIFDLNQILTDNTTILISSHLAEDMDLTKDTSFPLKLSTRFKQEVPIPFTNQTTLVDFNVNLFIQGIYDSNRPGIGSQHRGVIMSLDGLQDWIKLSDMDLSDDFVNSYAISFKNNHFNQEIDEKFLQEKFDALTEAITVNKGTDEEYKLYSISSTRLIFFRIIDFIFTILSAMLTTLGMMIVLTGILLITNVQLMSVEDREFQTGVLRAVGENRRGIFTSILIETSFQGILGGILGLLGGIAFGQLVALYLADLFGTGQFSVQPVIQNDVIIFAVFVGVLIGIITGILPALRASRVNIVVALRGIKVAFEEKSGRNLAFIGVILSIIGLYFLLTNGIINEDLDYIWVQAGWNQLAEWKNILLGAGFLFTGLGMVLSKYIDRIKAFNLTAIFLWGTPTFMFVVAFDGWVIEFTNIMEVLLISLVEIVIGSVLLVGVNLSPLMRFLRSFIINLKGLKGVGQISPALISSHKTRSTLTFAIFAVVLTLNVVVASLVATNIDSTIGRAEFESRGIDLMVTLSVPENTSLTTYTEELYNLDSSITDVIGFRTYSPIENSRFDQFVATKDPNSPEFSINEDVLPLDFGEIKPDQIRGDSLNANDEDWRYDFYLDDLPDNVTEKNSIDISNDEALELSRLAWDKFFDPSYTMTAYNISFGFGNFDFEGGGGFGSGGDIDDDPLIENGTIVRNPIVFTDSFILPHGMQIWVPMNTSDLDLPVYQKFTVGGAFDNQRGGGFPLAASFADGGFGDDGFSQSLGTIYFPDRFSNYTTFFGDLYRAPNAYDSFLIKTSHPLDSPENDKIALRIEEFTNTLDKGYREIIGDNFIVATAKSLFSRISATIEISQQFTSFLQIYVSFGLVIGAVGMAVISVRNVAERRREIGMMRAIGFPRYQVMLSALLELVVLGLIGLAIGVVNGLIINIGFARIQDVPVVIPWDTLGVYLSFITIVALIAGAIPGWVASRIPAAEALRYVG